MKIIKSSDWLIGENKHGGKKFWRLHILRDGKDYHTQSEWYNTSTTGKESKKQLSTPYFAEPTNVGRSNERNSEQQAEFEFDAIIKKQRDKGFRADGEKKMTIPMPMLAHKFKDNKHKVNWPVFVQPKLNGMRMLFDGQGGWSRGNKDVIPDVINHLSMDTAGFILDGELMLPGNVLLQETMTAIKRYRPELSPKLIYCVYDVVDESVSFEKRNKIVNDVCNVAPENVKIVNTYICHNEIEVMQYHKQFVSGGYEGTMIRFLNAPYEIGKRSYSLLKLKDFVDEEFRIVDCIDGEGSDTGLAIFTLDAGNGQTFNCRPEGTQENRAELFKNRNQLIGKYLTVRYFEKSRDNIPIFPVGVSIREWGEF